MKKKHSYSVITSVPFTDTEGPLMAPALLKSSLNAAGIETTAIDLNQEVKHIMENSKNENSIKKFLNSECVDAEAVTEIKNIFDYMSDRILSYKPAWVCLSLLTYLSQISCKWLCFSLKKKEPNIKIVIGGPGVFISLKGVNSFADELLSTGLIDHYISGDGEESLVNLLSGNKIFPGVDTVKWKQVENLNSLPLPDYSDYNFTLYKIKSTPIWGSRGCVRHCTFCDIHEHWNKFQWRTADNIFEEMKNQYEKYGINTFNFTDSLINGNQKEYKKLIRLLSDYNHDKKIDEKIKWSSFFIFRPTDSMSEEDWKLTADSGALVLYIGVESFVEKIRYHIKKKFSNEDLDCSLKFAQKYKIPLLLSIIVGYVTETDEDHQTQLAWIRNNKHFANNSVVKIRIGSTLSVLPGTWLYRNKEQLGISLGQGDVYVDWICEKTGSTPQVRLRRHKEIEKTLIENGFGVDYNKDTHITLESYVKKYHEKN